MRVKEINIFEYVNKSTECFKYSLRIYLPIKGLWQEAMQIQLGRFRPNNSYINI